MKRKSAYYLVDFQTVRILFRIYCQVVQLKKQIVLVLKSTSLFLPKIHSTLPFDTKIRSQKTAFISLIEMFLYNF